MKLTPEQKDENERLGFDRNTKAIRVKIRLGSEYQSRVFFPRPTLNEALKDAKEYADEMLKSGFRVAITEAKRVRL